jgi:hypothetical protein
VIVRYFPGWVATEAAGRAPPTGAAAEPLVPPHPDHLGLHPHAKPPPASCRRSDPRCTGSGRAGAGRARRGPPRREVAMAVECRPPPRTNTSRPNARTIAPPPPSLGPAEAPADLSGDGGVGKWGKSGWRQLGWEGCPSRPSRRGGAGLRGQSCNT